MSRNIYLSNSCAFNRRLKHFKYFFLQIPGGSGGKETSLLAMLEYTRQYGSRVYKFWFGPFRPMVRLVHPDTVKLILRTAEPKEMSNGAYSHAMPWLGNVLI